MRALWRRMEALRTIRFGSASCNRHRYSWTTTQTGSRLSACPQNDTPHILTGRGSLSGRRGLATRTIAPKFYRKCDQERSGDSRLALFFKGKICLRAVIRVLVLTWLVIDSDPVGRKRRVGNRGRSRGRGPGGGKRKAYEAVHCSATIRRGRRCGCVAVIRLYECKSAVHSTAPFVQRDWSRRSFFPFFDRRT